MKNKYKLSIKARRLLRKVQRSILAKPQQYDQSVCSSPVCGSPSCICGWMAYHAETDLEYGSRWHSSKSRLGLTTTQFYKLFSIDSWPVNYAIGISDACSDNHLAKIASKRIDHFIKSDGKE